MNNLPPILDPRYFPMWLAEFHMVLFIFPFIWFHLCTQDLS